jgi:methionyl-tRNA synthetase
VQRYRGGTIPRPGERGEREVELQRVALETRERAGAALNSWEIGNALNIIWNLVRRTNQYLEHSEPWKIARHPDQAGQLDTVLYSAAEATRLLAIFLAPYLPSTSNRILEQLGLPVLEAGAWQSRGTWGSDELQRVVPGPLLFPRIEADSLVS